MFLENQLTVFCPCVCQSVCTIVGCLLEAMVYGRKTLMALLITVITAVTSIWIFALRAETWTRIKWFWSAVFLFCLLSGRRMRWTMVVFSTLVARFRAAVTVSSISLILSSTARSPCFRLLVWSGASLCRRETIRWWQSRVHKWWLLFEASLSRVDHALLVGGSDGRNNA